MAKGKYQQAIECLAADLSEGASRTVTLEELVDWMESGGFAKLIRATHSIAGVIEFIKDEGNEFNLVSDLPGREDIRKTSPWLFERKGRSAKP